jgi:hypothetical protein
LEDKHWIFFKKQLGEIFGKLFLGGGNFWFLGRFYTSGVNDEETLAFTSAPSRLSVVNQVHQFLVSRVLLDWHWSFFFILFYLAEKKKLTTV